MNKQVSIEKVPSANDAALHEQAESDPDVALLRARWNKMEHTAEEAREDFRNAGQSRVPVAVLDRLLEMARDDEEKALHNYLAKKAELKKELEARQGKPRTGMR